MILTVKAETGCTNSFFMPLIDFSVHKIMFKKLPSLKY